MTAMGRERSACTGIRQSKFPRSKFLRKNLRKNSTKNFRKKSVDRIPEKIRRTSRALPGEVSPILEAGTPKAGMVSPKCASEDGTMAAFCGNGRTQLAYKGRNALIFHAS